MPSSLNCAPRTPTLSAALAETVTVPATVAPAVGAVMVTVGGVTSFTTVKTLELVAVPAGVVTLSGPVVGPLGTVAEMAVAEVTEKLTALVPLKRTAVAPVKAVALIGPVVAPLGTVAEIEVAEVTEKLTALVPLKVTAVAPVKAVPLSVTLLPTGPLVGVKLVIVGAGITVKLLVLVAVPPGVVTLTGPVVAPLGTVAAIEVDEVTEKLTALVPLNVTDVAPVKAVPLSVTLLPTGPLVGVKLAIVGALAVTVKLLELVAVPPGVVTLSSPLVAPLG